MGSHSVHLSQSHPQLLTLCTIPSDGAVRWRHRDRRSRSEGFYKILFSCAMLQSWQKVPIPVSPTGKAPDNKKDYFFFYLKKVQQTYLRSTVLLYAPIAPQPLPQL